MVVNHSQVLNDSGMDPRLPWRTLPPGLTIADSTIEGAGQGVFAEQDFPPRTRFGPYGGTKTKNGDTARDSGYSWEVSVSFVFLKINM